MGGIEVSRDGGAHQETVRVVFEEIISTHFGGDSIPIRRMGKMCICALTWT